MRPVDQQGTLKLCIAKDMALLCQQRAAADGYPLSLTQAVNAALRNHLSASDSATKDTDDLLRRA